MWYFLHKTFLSTFPSSFDLHQLVYLAFRPVHSADSKLSMVQSHVLDPDGPIILILNNHQEDDLEQKPSADQEVSFSPLDVVFKEPNEINDLILRTIVLQPLSW